jgi:acetyl-CoA carboxylase biotin carboxyl carrier protein
MQRNDIQQLSDWLAATDIEVLELRGPDHHVCLHREGTKVVPVAYGDSTRADPVNFIAVTATSVGVFLDRHPLRQVALAPPGATIFAGQVIGLLQVGALLVPVNSVQGGSVERALVAHGATVGFGTPLLELSSL